MKKFVIKVHTEGNQYQKPHLFSLSKGYNVGRPLKDPCPNCFVILTDSEEEKQKMFFLLDGIWRSQIFRVQLVGSVIPFIHVHEFAKTVNRYWDHVHECDKRVDKLISAFAAIEKLQSQIQGLTKLLDQYKSIAYLDVLKIQKAEF